MFGKGFIKVVVIIGVWILIGGVNIGVVKYVGDVFKEYVFRLFWKICIIGIVLWGVIENRNDFVGRDVVVFY